MSLMHFIETYHGNLEKCLNGILLVDVAFKFHFC